MKYSLWAIGMLVISTVLLASCGDPPPPPTSGNSGYEVWSHSAISTDFVPMLDWEVREQLAPYAGWKIDTEVGLQGYLQIGRTTKSAFSDSYIANHTNLEKQIDFDTRRAKDALLNFLDRDEDGIPTPELAAQVSIVSLAQRYGTDIDGYPSISRELDLRMPSVMGGNTDSWALEFLKMIETGTFDSASLKQQDTRARFRVFYQISPLVSEQGTVITIDAKPAVMRLALLAPNTNTEAIQYMREQVVQHALAPYVASGVLELDKQYKETLQVPVQQRSVGIMFVFDASTSVQRIEFEDFVDGALAMIDVLQDQNINPTVGVARSCDGEFQVPVVTSDPFATGIDQARDYIIARADELFNDDACRSGGSQLLLAVEKLLQQPPDEYANTDQQIAWIFSDGDDHSHPQDCQDCIEELNVNEFVAAITQSSVQMGVSAPKRRCLAGEINSIETAARLFATTRDAYLPFVDVCNTSWIQENAATFTDIVATQSPYKFAHMPILETMEIAHDGQDLPRGGSDGYEIDYKGRALTFGNRVPLVAGENIEVSGITIKRRALPGSVQ